MSSITRGRLGSAWLWLLLKDACCETAREGALALARHVADVAVCSGDCSRDELPSSVGSSIVCGSLSPSSHSGLATARGLQSLASPSAAYPRGANTLCALRVGIAYVAEGTLRSFLWCGTVALAAPPSGPLTFVRSRMPV